MAYDGGQKNGSLDITVNIIDVNDNPPRFEHETYEVSVREDVPVGSTVLNVSGNFFCLSSILKVYLAANVMQRKRKDSGSGCFLLQCYVGVLNWYTLYCKEFIYFSEMAHCIVMIQYPVQ